MGCCVQTSNRLLYILGFQLFSVRLYRKFEKQSKCISPIIISLRARDLSVTLGHVFKMDHSQLRHSCINRLLPIYWRRLKINLFQKSRPDILI